MNPLLKEIRHNRLLWLLAVVPILFAAEIFQPDAHTLLFILSILAIVPLAALLSRATESVAAKTGDTIGGLLNATLGNLTELIIALTALKAGQYVLVKASIAGAIVTNVLFMLGASLLLGGLKHHVQEYNRNNARLQASLLFLATVGLLIPSVLTADAPTATAAFTQQLSLGLAVLLIIVYGLGMVFSLKTHRELFGSSKHAEHDEEVWPTSLALATLAGVTVLVALTSEIFVESMQHAAKAFGMSPAFVGFIIVALVGGAAEMVAAFSGARKNRLGSHRRHRARQRIPDRAVRRARAGAAQLRHGSVAHEPAILARCDRYDDDRDHDRVPGHQRRPFGLVCRRARCERVPDLRLGALSAAAASAVKAGATCAVESFS